MMPTTTPPAELSGPMRRELLRARPDGTIHGMPHSTGLGLQRRGYGERTGKDIRASPGSMPKVTFLLNEEGRRKAAELQDEEKYQATYSSTLEGIPGLLEDHSIEQLIRRAETLLEKIKDSPGVCDGTGSLRGYLDALRQYDKEHR